MKGRACHPPTHTPHQHLDHYEGSLRPWPSVLLQGSELRDHVGGADSWIVVKQTPPSWSPRPVSKAALPCSALLVKGPTSVFAITIILLRVVFLWTDPRKDQS